MKKLVTICAALALASAANAQSQRLVLLEGFTQASCGPCAAQNPALHTVIVANTAPVRKVTSIKYQTSWPGVDPMNAHNPTDVATRVTYYGVQGVPDAFNDGNVQAGVAPSAITQATIDAEYAVASPFDIALSHVVSSDGDSIYVTMAITCTQATNGNFVAQIGVVEEEVHFTSAPGTNGEKDFYGVMKKMLPNAGGNTLPATWTVGQTQTITQSWALANIYNLNEVAVTAWIQNNTNKNVAQAAYSEPILNPNAVDAALAIPATASYFCTTSYTPSFTMTNEGGAALTSCDIQYRYDGGAVQTYNWTGNLATGASATISLPAATLTAGSHTLQLTATNTNALDVSSVNNQKTLSFFVSTGNTPAPVAEAFATTTFPAATWYNNDADGDGAKWVRSTTGHNGAGSAKLTYYSIAAGSTDDLYLPVTNMVGTTNPQLTFDVAHKIYGAGYDDELQVNVSTDCGATWTTIYQKAGLDLAISSTAQTTAYTPAAADWRLETVDLANYANETNLLVRFRGISAYGNNIYIDNVNLREPVGFVTPTELASNLTLAPNPANETVRVDFSLNNSSNVAIQVVNTLGQVVFTQSQDLAAGAQTLNINTASLANGTYTISLISDNKVSAKRFVVAH